MRPTLRRGPSLLCALALLAACSSASSKPARDDGARVIALEGVTVIDGTGAPPRPGMTVLIEDGRIAAVFPVGGGEVPGDAERPEVRGMYVIPGLIDAHVHLATFERDELHAELLRYALLGGVTTVRDMGGNTARVAELARGARDPGALSPRIFFSAVVAGPRWFATYDSARVRYWSAGHPAGRAPGVRMLSADAQVDSIVDEARAMGATGIKVYSDVAPARLAALARAAHARGLRVWAHAIVPPSGPDEVAAAGADVVSHADMLVWAAAGAGDTLASRTARARLFRAFPPDSPPIDSLLARMKARGTLFEPTLLVMFRGMAREESPAGARLDPLLEWAAGVTRRAHAAGVPVVAGTDAMGTTIPGIHAEMQLLVSRAGMTPLEAIRAATQTAARALGAEDSLGTVAVGRAADLVLLRADPSADIRNTQTVAHVVRAGRLHRREEPWRPAPMAEPAPGTREVASPEG